MLTGNSEITPHRQYEEVWRHLQESPCTVGWMMYEVLPTVCFSVYNNLVGLGFPHSNQGALQQQALKH